MKLVGGFFVWEDSGWLNTLSVDDICGHSFRNDGNKPVANIYVRGAAAEDAIILCGPEATDFHHMWMQLLEEEEQRWGHAQGIDKGEGL